VAEAKIIKGTSSLGESVAGAYLFKTGDDAYILCMLKTLEALAEVGSNKKPISEF
jgi:hypothetical protein